MFCNYPNFLSVKNYLPKLVLNHTFILSKKNDHTFLWYLIPGTNQEMTDALLLDFFSNKKMIETNIVNVKKNKR